MSSRQQRLRSSVQPTQGRPRFRRILMRLIKKCNREPESKEQHKRWWEQLLLHRPPELQKALEGLRLEISKKISECWEKADWLSQLDQAHRNSSLLVFKHRDIKTPSPRSKKAKAPDTAHVNIEEVGRRLIRCVDGVTLIPPGFTRLAPMFEADQTLAELANLLGAQRGPVNQDDAVAVERDIIHILRLMGPRAALSILNQATKAIVFSPRWRCWRRPIGTGKRTSRPLKSQNSCLQRKAGWPSSTDPRSTSLMERIGLQGISAIRPSYTVKHG